jgi:putative endonuclease
MEDFYYTYVLLSEKDNKNYAGYTKNLKLRFEQHQNGMVNSTKDRRPLKLIYFEACLSQADALKREKYFKTHYGRMFLKNRLANWFAEKR